MRVVIRKWSSVILSGVYSPGKELGSSPSITYMTKVFNDWSDYDEWLKRNVMNISVSNITEVNKRLLITYEEK